MKHALALVLLAVVTVPEQPASPAPAFPLAIMITEYPKTPDAPLVHFLAGDYGFLANCEEGKAAEYYFYDKPKHEITYLTDFDEFLRKLQTIPNGSAVDKIERCAPPFWQAMPIEKRNQIKELLKNKQCKMTNADNGNFTVCVCKGSDEDEGSTLRLLKRAR